MSNALTKEDRALLETASEMFAEMGCVPGIDGEEVPAQTIVPDAKERWSFHGWHKNGVEDATSSHLTAIRTLSSI